MHPGEHLRDISQSIEHLCIYMRRLCIYVIKDVREGEDAFHPVNIIVVVA